MTAHTFGDGAVGDHHSTRLANRTKVLRSLVRQGPATRAELARRTELSRPTVSVIVADLLTSGVLTEGERVASGGAPGTLLHIARDTGVTVVLDLRDMPEATVGMVSADGEVMNREQLSTGSLARVRDRLVERINTPASRSWLGLALAVPGFADPGRSAPRSRDHHVVADIADELRAALKLPVLVVGTVEAITMADLHAGPEDVSGQATFVVPEAAAGLIMHGEPLVGTRRPAGDFSHVVPGLRGPECSTCGRPCLRAFTDALLHDDTSTNRQGFATALAAIMAPVAAAIDMEYLLLSGLPAPASGTVVEQTLSELGRRLPAEAVPAVAVSRHDKDAVLIGAAALMVFSRLR